MSVVSNSLLSLAKILQDEMNPNTNSSPSLRSKNYRVKDILALYYLSLSLQPSPSTANNVGILLAGVHTPVPKLSKTAGPSEYFMFNGVLPGSGVALALMYYKYGLSLDSNHAHLFTNLGSLLKDIGQLPMAISMYEKAVLCDPKFDIALANLANAVKDQGRISDAIYYYKQAVSVNSNFAEAVCGLANALNSVCDWAGRGGVFFEKKLFDRWHVDDGGNLYDSKNNYGRAGGWMQRTVEIANSQLREGQAWGMGCLSDEYIDSLSTQLATIESSISGCESLFYKISNLLRSWKGRSWEGAKVMWLIERAVRRLGWKWYQEKFVRQQTTSGSTFVRPVLPASLSPPAAPTVLPFHTFTLPMNAKQIRRISQRNGLRVSCTTMRASWLPPTVFPPPSPPSPHIKVGYVSSDFNNHPLAHLMQSVFGMHDRTKVTAYCYATTSSDGSTHRQQIEREAPFFCDAGNWSVERLVNQIVEDGIHVLVNLNGYTRGARNEIFAARPAPIQMSFMGFAGTLGAEWCDYLLADETAVPPRTTRPYRRNVDVEDVFRNENSGGGKEDWIYAENIIYSRDSFFCCDHKQSAPDANDPKHSWEDEQARRWKVRKELFPDIPDDAVIFGNFNQLYKVIWL